MKNFYFKTFVYPIAKWYWKLFQPHTQGARALIIFSDEILLVKHAGRDHWSLPGGGVKKTENHFDGLLRELYEELRIPSIMFVLQGKIGTYQNTREGKQDTVEIFIVESSTKEFVRQYELDDAKWFNLERLPESASPATLRRIEEYKNGERNLEKVW